MTNSTAPGKSLHAKVVFFLGLIILTAVSSSTLFYVNNLRTNYLEAMEWRSVTLAQSLSVAIRSKYDVFGALADLDLILESAYLQCRKLFDANASMQVSFVSVLDKDGVIVTHNDKKFWKKRIDSPELRIALASKKVRTLLLGDDYNTLVPVIGGDGRHLATIDVGFPKDVVGQKVTDIINYALILCLILFLLVFFPTWLLIRKVVILPINQLVDATSNITKGNLTQDIDLSQIREFRRLGESLTRMRNAIRKNLEDLEKKNQEVKALIACSPVALFSIDLTGKVAIWTDSAQQMFGWEAEEVMGKIPPTVPGSEREMFHNICQRVCQDEIIMGHELMQKRRDGSQFHASLSSAPIHDSDGQVMGVMLTMENISQRIERENAHKNIQDQLLQSQKMESVGRLAGGVAHDYNNMLGVILGYAELVLEDLAPGDPNRKNIQQIIKATRHSADITRQLLAFARKQTIAPKIVDLNRQVESILKMLRRLIGENIELEWLPHANQETVKMDPMQIDQILANLCINARDAIGETGTITIETRSVIVDEDYCGSHPGFRPGPFVCLTVSDNGCGMDRETQEHIFEPFFTTKGKGEGTGLGLATVYGIIKQNDGFVNVYSEPGKGTTFNLYIPHHSGSIQAIYESTNTLAKQGANGETVLLVEDEEAILQLGTSILERLGYQVLAAQSPAQALDIAKEHGQTIALLITDVILPEMNGRELSQRILEICPHLKTLFMSGYTANVIAHQGVLDDGMNFIQKPFSKNDLALKVQFILGH